MSPLPSLYLETIQRASYIIVQRYSNIQSEATGRTLHQQKTSEQNGFSPTLIIVTLKLYLCILYDRLSDMAKNTMGTKLPRKLELKMQVVGEQIKLARLRRNLSIAQVAERATCSTLTVSRIERGTPSVSIGIYLRVLYALQLEDDILYIAREDELGRRLQDLSLVTRRRASKKE